MKTTLFSEDTILAFKVGRGGHFNNGGYLSFLDYDRPISYYTDDLFNPIIRDENGEAENDEDDDAEWTDDQGRSVKLTNAEYKSGIGTIDYDGIYKTYYTKRLKDINEDEAYAIMRDHIFHIDSIDADFLEVLYNYQSDAVTYAIANNYMFSGIDTFCKVLNAIPNFDYFDVCKVIEANQWTELGGDDICTDGNYKITLVDTNTYDIVYLDEDEDNDGE